jgi:hypothetical protein
VPAAAVIPAPIAYIKVVAVKKLVVETLASEPAARRRRCSMPSACKRVTCFNRQTSQTGILP